MNRDFQIMPEQASSIAAEVDALYLFLVGISAAFTVLIAALIIYFAIKYRRGSLADRSQGASHFFFMELSWIVVPFLLSMIMFFWGADLYFRQFRPPEGAMEIGCVAKQWMWKFQHPEGHQEINDLHVPLGQAVRVHMISEDVIHDLYIPAFRIKMDVLPGRYTTLWFQPTKVGEYHLFCAEYCGAKHSEMRGTVYVMEPSEYQAWLSGRGRTATPAESGRQLLEDLRCNNCHRGGGVASRCPPLEGLFGSAVPLRDGSTVIADENYIRESILRPAAKVVAGYEPIMPSFEGQIGEQGLMQLVAEIKSLSAVPRNPPEGAVSPEAQPGATRDP
jgi:cytochrome c oxidase subunit II